MKFGAINEYAMIYFIIGENFLQALQTSFSTTTDLATEVPQLPY